MRGRKENQQPGDLEKWILRHLFCRSYHSEQGNFCHNDVSDAMTKRDVPVFYFSPAADLSARNVQHMQSPVWLQEGERELSPSKLQVNEALLALAKRGHISVHKGLRNQGIGFDLTQKGAKYVRDQNLLDMSAAADERVSAVVTRARDCPRTQEQSLAQLKGLVETALGNRRLPPGGAHRKKVHPWPVGEDRQEADVNTADIEKAKDGVLALLNIARFSRRQALTVSQLQQLLRGTKMEKINLLPSLSIARVMNPFQSQKDVVEKAVEKLEESRLVELSPDGKAWRLTPAAVERFKRGFGDEGLPRRIEELTVDDTEFNRWEINASRFGNRTGEYVSQPGAGVGRA